MALGKAQKKHFDRMTPEELREARRFSNGEIGRLEVMVAAGGASAQAKIEDHEARVQYIEGLLVKKKT